jgi:hypothetical protein
VFDTAFFPYTLYIPQGPPPPRAGTKPVVCWQDCIAWKTAIDKKKQVHGPDGM